MSRRKEIPQGAIEISGLGFVKVAEEGIPIREHLRKSSVRCLGQFGMRVFPLELERAYLEEESLVCVTCEKVGVFAE